MKIIITTMILLITFTTILHAGTAKLSWTENTEKDLAGYKIYMGVLPGSYDTILNIGNSISYLIKDLTPGRTYYFSITAYDTSSNESGFSNEVSKTIVAIDTIAPKSIDSITVIKK